jgi:pyruvate/2-oxoglutarate dehydrogenase complex dihydrolipoamide dehydrogenase (E3) component
MNGRYEVVVIGAGPAEGATAELAGNLGYPVALAERDTVGGTVATNGGAPAKTIRELQKGPGDWPSGPGLTLGG